MARERGFLSRHCPPGSRGPFKQDFFPYLWWLDVTRLDRLSFFDGKQTSAAPVISVVETLLGWLSFVGFGCRGNEGPNIATHALRDSGSSCLHERIIPVGTDVSSDVLLKNIRVHLK